MKDVQFTKHAEEKLSERNIDKSLIICTIKGPGERLPGKGNAKVVHRNIGNKLLRVVFREDEHNYIVITAYFTEKERYEVKK